MTQPPDQPPQGGYGAPQGQGPYPPPQFPPPPPPSGPPQPYGYGHPNPYGPPQPQYGAAPTPYGGPPHAQPPYGRPPYGHQPPPGGGRKRNGRMVAVAAVAAVALLVGAGVWYASTTGGATGKDDRADSAGPGGGNGEAGGGDPSAAGTEARERVPSDTASEVLFQVPAPKVEGDASYVVQGSWLTDRVYAKSGIAEVVGYDLDKGTKRWTVKLPGPVCDASRHMTADHRTAVLFQPAMPTEKKRSHGCSEVAVIDLEAGEKVWSGSVERGAGKAVFSNVTLSGTTVAVGGVNGGAAFDLPTGDLLWSPKSDATCYDAGYGGGPALVVLRKCGEYGGERQLRVQTLDAETGRPLSEYRMTPGIDYASIVSTEPLVVAADAGDSAGDGSGISDFFSVDGRTGELRARITAPGDKYAARCDGIMQIENCSQLAVGNGKLYVATEEHDGKAEHSRTNEIVAFDLGTGKQTGERADAGDGYTLAPLRMDGPDLIAYKRPPYDESGQVVSIDGGSFEATTLLETPADETVRRTEARFTPAYAEILYGDGRLFMSRVFTGRLYGDGTEYLAVAFGAE
ncbi:hypothetical protein GCM10010145_03330 [Streptomyces ruber]|uniref:Pyrrolo-quinoline quinone repeat domain-containing protein n=2 Tax=Streptomyces TaxID=1883 RepID=A0A918B7A2_9ACTN|nr:PQQ-binding-like beta-propeller repeat protein [Streptomyces ruber]GGQ39147.1 hypothetical protein GCM10010145_03330 [Streptomyces ruber]